jgi:hypothetical protein
VVQDRNPHDFLHDLSQELGGYLLTETLVEYLRGFRTSESDYHGAYLDLIYHLRASAESDSQLERPEQEYFRLMLLGMAAWHSAVGDVLGRTEKADRGRHVPTPRLISRGVLSGRHARRPDPPA